MESDLVTAQARGSEGKGENDDAMKIVPRTQNEWILSNIGARICIIDLTSLVQRDTPVSYKGGNQLICSYDWMNRGEPTISVPGRPPRYIGMALPRTLALNTGPVFNNQNSFWSPKHQFEPVFRAAGLMNPKFRFDAIDLLADRSALRKFLDISRGRAKDTFCMNLSVVQNTLVVERCEQYSTRNYEGKDRVGYSLNLQGATTVAFPGLEDSTGHFRVLQYKLGDLNCAVRFEVNAEYKASSLGKIPVERNVDKGVSKSEGSRHPPGIAPREPPRITDTEGRPLIFTSLHGSVDPDAESAEIQAVVKGKRSKSWYMDGIWFGRTKHLITGRHKGGAFDKMNVSCAEDRFEDWETTNQEALRKMVTLLTELRLKASAAPGKTCVCICNNRSSPLALQVFARDGAREVLPADVVQAYWGGDEQGESPQAGGDLTDALVGQEFSASLDN